MDIHFISDLHLSADRPALVGLFERYLAGPARGAAKLYILGDLLEYWAGDDDVDDPLATQVAAALAQLAESGSQVFFMAGNRDLLIGADFAKRAGFSLIDEPTLIQLGTESALLCHGDSLCTDDAPYQAYRTQIRNPAWQQQFLSQPLAARKQFIQGLRMKSEAAKTEKAAAIMDVNADAVADLLRNYGYPRLIHGHTHRPTMHALEVDGHACERWVLADWQDERGEILVWNGTSLNRQEVL